MSTTAWTQLGLDVDGTFTNEMTAVSVSLNAAGTRMAVGAPHAAGKGSVKVYDYNGTSWSQTGATFNGTSTNENYGRNVSLSADGTRLAIGSSYIGIARIYDFNGTSWTQKGSDIYHSALQSVGDSQKYLDLSVDGTSVAIADCTNNSSTGRVSVYKFDGSNWVASGQAITGTFANNSVGWAVTLNSNGTRMAFSTQYNNYGSVRIFDLIGSTWTEIGTGIINSPRVAGDFFGDSLSLSGDGIWLAIGVPNGGSSQLGQGAVIIYKFNGSSWSKVQTLNGETGQSAKFGKTVHLSTDGTRMAIGAPEFSGPGTVFSNDGTRGRTYIYAVNTAGSNWALVGDRITGEQGANSGSSPKGDQSGTSLSLNADGTRVAIGAPFNDVGGANTTNKGHVRVFEMLKPPTAPDAPTIGQIVTGNSQATVNFTAPVKNGGAAISGYTVKLYNGTTSAFIKDTVNNIPSATSVVVTGLTNGTAYKFSVLARNSVGSSVASSLSASVTLPTAPSAATIGSATAGNAQASVAFTPSASNGGATVTYTATSSPGGLTGNASASPIVVTGLTNGIAYTFTVVASNSAGSAASSAASASVISLTSAVSFLNALGSITNGVVMFMSVLKNAIISGASLVNTVSLGISIPTTATAEQKKTATKNIITTIFENQPTINSFKVKRENVAIAASNVKEEVLIAKSSSLPTAQLAAIILDDKLDSKTSVYTSLENVGDKQKFQYDSKVYIIEKIDVTKFEFTDVTAGTTTEYTEGYELIYNGLVIVF